LPPAPPAPELADFDEVFDFQSAMNVLVQAERSFMGLPANVRKRFSNDPGQMMEFLNDSSNYDEAVKLGLVQARTPVSEAPEPVVTTPQTGEHTSST
jgi:Chlamydia-phage Chp2 scaffold (Chlamy_scaf).